MTNTEDKKLKRNINDAIRWGMECIEAGEFKHWNWFMQVVIYDDNSTSARWKSTQTDTSHVYYNTFGRGKNKPDKVDYIDFFVGGYRGKYTRKDIDQMIKRHREYVDQMIKEHRKYVEELEQQMAVNQD